MLRLAPFDETFLPALALLRSEDAAPGSLRRELTDVARGGGRQVVVAVEDGTARGVAGWVCFGLEAEGLLYGAPVLAGSREAADLLLGHLVARARTLGARQLRVSRYVDEDVKAAALAGLGFLPLLDMISMERPSAGLPEVPMPPGLCRVPFGVIDWPRFAAAFNTAFASVPNAPPLSAALKRLEWEELDPEASQLWQDSTGRYAAWIGVDPAGQVDEVGVDESLRGRGIAMGLYRIAGEALLARGVGRLTTLLASTNTATLRLHEKLGFTERSRRTVFALDVQATAPGTGFTG